MLTRLAVKTLLVFGTDLCSGLIEQPVLKDYLDQAKTLNQQLVSQHQYSKYETCIDLFETSVCSDYLSIKEFN